MRKKRRRILKILKNMTGLDLIKYRKGNTIFYRKDIGDYFKQFPLKYAKALSKELDIPMVNYKFVTKEKDQRYLNEDSSRRKYYYLSVDYEESLKGYEYIENPFNIDLGGSDWLSVLNSINIDTIIGYMKEFCANYKNGREVYDEYLKQILLSFFISDVDRNHENVKLYRKGDYLKLVPYFDLDFIFSIDDWSIAASQLIQNYQYYLPPEEMQEWCDEYNSDPMNIEDETSLYTIDRLNSEFNELFDKGFDSLYGEQIFTNDDNFHWEDLFTIIYNEISDKSIFDKIHKLDYEELEKKYDLDMTRNARIMISNLFYVRKKEFDDFYKKLNRIL